MMKQKHPAFRILLIDDIKEQLDGYTKVLEHAGYEVIPALVNSQRKAMDKLTEVYVHAAVVDQRLTGSDAADTSGWAAVRMVSFPAVRIVFTYYDIESRWLTDTLRTKSQGAPGVIEFVDKKIPNHEEEGGLLERLRTLIPLWNPINFDLQIQFRSGSIISLIDQTFPHVDARLLGDYKFEIEDLFRTAFACDPENEHDRYIQIVVDGLPVRTAERQWLHVSAFSQHRRQHNYYVLWGEQATVRREYENYLNYRGRIALSDHPKFFETLHFGLTLYPIPFPLFETLQSFNEFYEQNPEELVELIEPLFDNLLNEVDPYHDDPQTTGSATELLAGISLDVVTAQLPELIHHLFVQFNVHRKYVQPVHIHKQILDIGKNIPNPAYYAPSILGVPATRRMRMTHGGLNLDTALVAEDHTFALDYGDTDIRSALRDYVELELTFRLRKLSGMLVDDQHLFEPALLEENFDINLSLLPDKYLPAIETIRLIRSLAYQKTGHTLDQYFHDLLAFTLLNLNTYPFQQAFVDAASLQSYMHSLILAGHLCAELDDEAQVSAALPANLLGSIVFVEENKTVWLRGQSLSIKGNSFRILKYLYDANGEFRTYEEIERDALGGHPEGTVGLSNRMGVSVTRVRKKLEGYEKYIKIVSEPGGYYLWLNLNGEE